MKKVKLGLQGLEVSRIGLGCMILTQVYGVADKNESRKIIQKALELGITFFDTSDHYGKVIGENELLVGEVLSSVREKVVIATKFGFTSNMTAQEQTLDGSAKHVKKACEDSLKRLKTDYIDLYYLHRIDPKIPIEETIQAMSDLVKEGKIKYIGVSEVTADLLERANKIHTISAVQNEYSLWTRDNEIDGTLQKSRELNIGFVAYSPLGRGFLTGTIKDRNSLKDNDWRTSNPRFTEEAIQSNLPIVQTIQMMADQKSVRHQKLLSLGY